MDPALLNARGGHFLPARGGHYLVRSGLMMVCAARFASGADKASLLVTSKSLSMACQRHTHYAVHKKLVLFVSLDPGIPLATPRRRRYA